MIKRILKWTGIIILLLVVGITVVTASRQHLKYDAPYPNVHASKDAAVIERGRHLVLSIAHCAECHSTSNTDSLLQAGVEIPFSGGRPFVLPVGTIYSKNITPDKETGIGNYTDEEIARVIRYSVHPNGDPVYNFMSFHNMSDADISGVISFLRTLQPIKNKVPDNRLNLMGNLVKAYMVKPVGPSGEVPAYVKSDTTAAYGKYLVLNIGNCAGCHSKHDISGAYTGPLLAGGDAMNGLMPPNLTTDSSGKLLTWSQEKFITRFHQGKIIANSEMPWNSFKNMSDDELKAIYKFLKSLPPAKNPVK